MKSPFLLRIQPSHSDYMSSRTLLTTHMTLTSILMISRRVPRNYPVRLVNRRLPNRRTFKQKDARAIQTTRAEPQAMTLEKNPPKGRFGIMQRLNGAREVGYRSS
jgi:hypothetical protein